MEIIHFIGETIKLHFGGKYLGLGWTFGPILISTKYGGQCENTAVQHVWSRLINIII